jgi:hypothetical protein
MRNALFLGLGVMVAICSTSCASVVAVPTSGRVVDQQTGAPIGGAMVLSYVDIAQLIHGHTCAHVELAHSDADGRFALKGAPLIAAMAGAGSAEQYFQVYRRGYRLVGSEGGRVLMTKQSDREGRLSEVKRLFIGLPCSGQASEEVAAVLEAVATEGAELARTPEEIRDYVEAVRASASDERRAAARSRATIESEAKK